MQNLFKYYVYQHYGHHIDRKNHVHPANAQIAIYKIIYFLKK
jgi:kynurenine formamidase